MLSQVTHHSAIFLHSVRNTAPKSNCALAPDGGNGPIGPRCVSLICHLQGDEIPLGNQMLDRLNKIRKDLGLQP
jgi:hypothetical protein